MIDAGYERPTDGVYPAEPVHFKIFPKPGKLFHDFLAIEEGADQTGENVEDLAEANTIQPFAAPGVGTGLMAAKQGPAPAAAPPPPAPKPTAKDEWKLPAVLQQSAPRFTMWQSPPPPPPVEEVPPPAEEIKLAPSDEEFLIDPNKVTNASVNRPTAGTANPAASLQKIANGVYDATLGRIIPRPTTAPAPASTAPDPTPGPTDPGPADPGPADPGPSDPGPSE